MLVRVDVISAQGSLLTLPLEDVEDGIIIADIQGLDPVKANLVSSGFAGIDGEQYQSASREKRNIKIQLELDPDPAVESVAGVRNRLYGFFMSKAAVTLRFYLDSGLDVTINGRVETCEQNMFSDVPMMDISIVCFDPDFFDPDTVVVSTTTTQGAFEKPLPYSGTVETGIKFTMTLNRSLSQFSIYHRLPSGQLDQLDFVAPLLSGDVLTISTVKGSKGATLVRSGVTSSILYGVSPQSKWFELFPGDNTIRIFDSGALIPYTVEYNTKYGAL
jgi:hypothetical protein